MSEFKKECSEEEQVVFFGLDEEVWFDVLDELFIVLAVDDEVEQGVDVALADGHEVEVDGVEGLEHHWGFLGVQPHLAIRLQVDGLEGCHEELGLMLDELLMLGGLSEIMEVALDLSHLFGVSQLSHERSELDELWDLVHGVVLHLPGPVVLLVEGKPLLVVDINNGSLVRPRTMKLKRVLGMIL